MITYEKFKEIIVKYIIFSKCDNTLREVNIDIFESPIFETTSYYLDWLWDAYFTEDGVDTINWWMFEYHTLEEDFDKNGNYIGDPDKDPGMWDKNDNVIPMITIKDLWEYVKDDRKEFVKTPEEQLKDTINKIAKTQIENAVEPIDLDVLKGAMGDAWEKISKFFDNVDKLVCVDNTDEVIADIMSAYIENKVLYIDAELEQCHIKIFLDTNVGTLLVLSAEDFELYVWQGQ